MTEQDTAAFHSVLALILDYVKAHGGEDPSDAQIAEWLSAAGLDDMAEAARQIMRGRLQ